MTFLKEVGNRIRKQRIKLGWTQTDLMNKLPPDIELTDKQISRLERGTSGTTLENFKELSLALEKTPDYFLLGINRKGDSVNEIIDETMEYLYLCDIDDLKTIQLIVKAFVNSKS